MSVGSKRIDFVDASTSNELKGNIIIDSGTTLTILLEKFYTKLEAEVEAHINLERVNSTDQILSLCYKSPPNNAIEVPIITTHFAGVDIVLNSLNTFVSVFDYAMWFAFAPVASGSIFGNLAQMNHLVGYDLLRKTIKKANPEAEFKEISTMVGAKWKTVTAEEKKPYEGIYHTGK
ncbi:hypothetical protein JHK87_042674 [Glycine soja]|nr:hypothetical protein JHK87_042674 [Glycine soja]